MTYQRGSLAPWGPTANQKRSRTRLAQPTLPTFLFNSRGAARRPLSWSPRPAGCVRRSLFIAALRTQGPCRRLLGQGELGLRDHAEPGGGQLSVLCLRQQPHERADSPPQSLGRVLLRGPPAGQCCPPGPCDVVPTPQTRGQDSESSHGARDAALPNKSASYPHGRAAAHLGKPTSLSPSYA